jgi:peptidoglycan/xylan/chitin deacetylase (PgdA/CDA1 family)
MKIIRRSAIAIVFLIVIFSAFYFFWLPPRYVVPILMYHRFNDEDCSICVTPENFARQMKYLRDKGYDVISLDELVRGIKNKRSFSHNSVVITTDDGYIDNYIYAYPVLKKYGFPATMFIITDSIGKQGFISWGQIEEMAAGNITFGGHSKSHKYLPSIKEEDVLWDEIFGCKKVLEGRISRPVDYFCYPVGGFTEGVKLMVRRAGYKGACSTNRGFAELNQDVYELKRVKVSNSDTTKPFNFWAKLSGYYNLFRSKRRGY